MDSYDQPSATFTLVVALEPNRKSSPRFTTSFPLSELEMDPYQVVRLWPALSPEIQKALMDDGINALSFSQVVLALYRQQAWAARQGDTALLCADDLGVTVGGDRVRLCVLTEESAVPAVQPTL